MDEKEKQALIQAVLANDAAGRKVLLDNPFAGLIPPRMNMSEIARKMFPVEQLPPGALPIYAKDPRRKCEECGSIFDHEDGCTASTVEDVMES